MWPVKLLIWMWGVFLEDKDIMFMKLFLKNIHRTHFVAKTEIYNALKPFHVSTWITHPDVRSHSKGKHLHVEQAVIVKYLKICCIVLNDIEIHGKIMVMPW